MDIEDISPITLIEDFKSSNTSNKLNSIRSIPTITFCLGKQRTLSELIPFLIIFSEEEEEMINLELLDQLENILNSIDINEYQGLLNLWEKIASMEEISIKNKACETFKNLFKKIKESKSTEHIDKLIERLVNKKEYYILLNILHIVFTKTSYDKCFKILLTLSQIDNYDFINTYIKLLPTYSGQNYLNINDFSLIIDNILKNKDYELVVKSNIIKPLVDSLLITKQINQSIRSILLSLIKEEEIKIKIKIVMVACDILKLNDQSLNIATILLIESCISLVDVDFKIILCENLFSILESISVNLKNKEKIISILTNSLVFAKDTNIKVRKAYASSYLKFSLFLERTEVNKYLIPTLLDLLKEENVDIKIELLRNINFLNSKIPIDDLFESIYQCIYDISQNKSWRSRNMLKLILPLLEENLSNKLLINKIFPLFLAWLSDPVYSIRLDAIAIIVNFLKKYNDIVWNSILTKIKELEQSQSYLLKVTLAKLLNGFLDDSKTKEYFNKFLIQVTISLAKSSVANIILNCERPVKYIKDNKLLGENELNEIIKQIEKLKIVNN